MGFKCFVAGCKSGYETQRKLDIAKNEKHPSLFKPPKDPAMLEIWRQVIPRADRKLRERDRVCELHFPEKDIVRYFETTVHDGEVFKLERCSPMLKEGAIPVLYPNLPKYSESLQEMVAELKFPARIKEAKMQSMYGELLKTPRAKKMRTYETSADTEDIKTEVDKSIADEDADKGTEMPNAVEERASVCADSTNTCADNTSACLDSTSACLDSTSACLDSTSACLDNTSAYADNTSACEDNTSVHADTTNACSDNVSVYADAMSPCADDASMGAEDTNMSEEDINANNGNTTEVERLTFNYILKNLESISKPNVSWGVSAHDKFVICAKWNENYMPEKRVIIDCNLNIKVFVKDKEVGSFKNLGLSSISDISTILHLIDN